MAQLKRKQTPIDLNEQFRLALDVIEHTAKSVFITGRAGTGKSTLLTYFRGTTRKKVAMLAPTGVAALNIKGQTIHSFFGFKPNISADKVKKLRSTGEGQNIYKKLDAIVIDEISMVRADLLDCVDSFLRLNGPSSAKPFGGIQMIFIGDLYQLSPVVTSSERVLFSSVYDSPYFYSAKVFDSMNLEFVELEKVYRQKDEQFLGLLNTIRNRSIAPDGLALLNTRCQPGFEAPTGQHYISLTTTNDLANEVNNRRLAALHGPLQAYAASIEGDFGKEYLPTAIELPVKRGAQVMLLNNDSLGRWVNGSIGEISGIERASEGPDVIKVKLADGEEVEVTPFTWEIFRFSVKDKQLQSDAIGKFTQYPLMLAWAVTIHKSQGKTFDRVIIDFGRGTFAHGQAYVALSRCTTLNGIVLRRPIRQQDILMDFNVVRFLTKYQYQKAAESLTQDDKVGLIRKAIKDKAALGIVYLKPNDEKSRRVIMPQAMGEMEYQGKTYLGLRAFCLLRREDRTFRIDRILEIKPANGIPHSSMT